MITLLLLASAFSSTSGNSPQGGLSSSILHHLVQRALQSSSPSSSSCPDSSNTRSVFNIVWSCLSTIFLCTWVSIHPNIPPAGEMGFITFLRRLKMMFVAVIAPEAIILFAMWQWMGARRESQKYKDRGWTMTHGYFLIMGGFVLMKGEEDMGVISCELLDELDKEGDIHFPVITRDQIEDRSKGDLLSKGLVILQTFWFLCQCIARGIQGLKITQFEVVTIAFCSLNATMYFLWWHKPLDVRCQVPVYIKDGSNYFHKPELQKAQKIQDEDEASRAIATALETEQEEPPSGPQVRSYLGRAWLAFYRVLAKSAYLPAVLTDFTSEGVPIFWLERDPDAGIIYSIVRWICFITELAFGLVFFLIGAPILFVIDDLFENSSLPPGQPGVRTFYAPEIFAGDWDLDGPSFLIILLVSVTPALFGSLHCIAWKVDFPTNTEHLMWKVLALLVTLLPAGVTVLGGFVTTAHIYAERIKARGRGFTSKIIYGFVIFAFYFFTLSTMAACTAYLVARGMLLILGAISLRDLPLSALVDVDWLKFIPHL